MNYKDSGGKERSGVQKKLTRHQIKRSNTRWQEGWDYREGRQRKTGRGGETARWIKREKELTGQPQWPLRVEEKWINRYNSHSVGMYSTAWNLLSVCLPASVCLTDTSVPSCLSLVQVLRCDNNSASLLSSRLARLNLLIQRATDGKLVSASSVSSLELIQQKHPV